MYVTYVAAKRVKTAVRLLRRRRRRLRPAERLGDRRRLPVGRVLPRHRRPDLALRLRRLHVLGGLAGGLHHRAAGDRRALPQHRQVHAVRHPRLPQRPEEDARSSAALSTITVSTFYLTAQMVGGGVLVKTLIGIDYEISVIARRRPDAGLRAVRRHGGDDLGADHQGRPAGDRVDPPGDPGVDALRLLPAGFLQARGRRPEGAGAGREAARRRRQEHDAGRTRPALPRAGPVLQGADRPDLAGHGAGVRHRRHAAHPDALLHRADGTGRAQVGRSGRWPSSAASTC